MQSDAPLWRSGTEQDEHSTSVAIFAFPIAPYAFTLQTAKAGCVINHRFMSKRIKISIARFSCGLLVIAGRTPRAALPSRPLRVHGPLPVRNTVGFGGSGSDEGRRHRPQTQGKVSVRATKRVDALPTSDEMERHLSTDRFQRRLQRQCFLRAAIALVGL